MTTAALYEHQTATPSATTCANPDRDRELCAKCGYTFAGHVSNTGVIYPCWTPSGRYQPVPPASAPRQTTGDER